MLVVNSRIQIPLDEFEVTFVRSSGPGGQNVNKVSTKAVLRWPVINSPSLPAEVKNRFLSKFANRISEAGDLLLTSQKYRDQIRNELDCHEKLCEMILSVAQRPTPRKKTRPTRASSERRMESKRQQASKKDSRKRVDYD